MASPSTGSSDEPLATGSVLDGRYRIEGVLGTGGMGRVYRAAHTTIGKSVAIKVLHATLGRNREASQRFQREALASGRLDHPNIVGVSDFRVLDDGVCYLVMELLEGESLGDRLDRDERVAWREAIEILRGVLCGLRHAHERGVVHRDIKPDNVFLAQKDGDRVIKILDFGIAKLFAGSEDDPASTRAGLTVGTPAYLSPEQAVGGAITPTSDLYSASIVLYEMLAGRAPFEDKDPLAMLGAHVSRRPPAFAVVAPGIEVPAELEAIIQRGLVKSAAERIASAASYLAMLDERWPPAHATRSGTFPVTPASSALAPSVALAPPVAPAAPAVPAALASPAALPQGAAVYGDRPGAAATKGQAHAPLAKPYGDGPREGAAVVTPGRISTVSATTPATAGAHTAAPVSLVLSRASHAVSLADVGDPIPLTWIIRSAVVTGLAVVLAVVLAIAARCTGGGSSTGAIAATAPASAAKTTEREAQLTGLLDTLEHGKTCVERRAPIGELVELRDRRAIAPLIRARDRIGTGDAGNACLATDADRALDALK